MADQPARALIIYGDGLMRNVAPRHSHLHSVAAAGSCGFLALRSQPDLDPNQSDYEARRVVGELAQLLDVHDIYQKQVAPGDTVASDNITAADEQIPSMSERFMGVKAGMFSTSEPAAALGKQAGFSVLELDEGNQVSSDHVLPEPSLIASRLLNLLGLDEACPNFQLSDFELLLLHLSAFKQKETQKDQGCIQQIDWVDKLLGALQALAQPGTKASSHLYLIVVLGFGPTESCHGNTPEEKGFPLVASGVELAPELAHLVPQQSYTMKGGHPVEGIREHHPLLVAYHLDAVTRRDEVNLFDYSEFQKLSGNLIILVDRFLHEVAFKLWKAPKYGA